MYRTKFHRVPKLLCLEARLAPAIINFTLTTATSSLTFGGTVGGAPIQAQGAGSLTTTYSGAGQVDVDFLNNTISTIAAGSKATANINGSWQPLVGGAAGSAPANYGAKVTIPIVPPFVFANALIAARNLAATLDSAAAPLSGAGATKTFPSTQNFVVVTGDADYNAGVLGTGTQSLIGNAATNQAATPGSFTDNGNGTYSLVTPIDVTINDTVSGQPAVYTIKGTLNATAVLPVVDLNGVAAGFDVSFTSTGTPAVAIAPSATITRNPSANLNGMTVTLASPPDGANESLAVDLTGTGLSTTGYDPMTGTLKVTGSGTLANYETALRKVAYSDTKVGPTLGARSVTVVVDDGTNVSLTRTANGTVVAPPAKVAGVQINDGSIQRSRVTSMIVTFDQHVSLPMPLANTIQLKRQGNDLTVGLVASVDNGGSATVVTLTFDSGPLDGVSLNDGRYTLTVVAANVNAGYFDGNGNGLAQGSPTDDYVITGDPDTNKLFRLYGDADGDGTVAISDFNLFRMAFGGSAFEFDFDGDGSVAISDFNEFRSRFGATV